MARAGIPKRHVNSGFSNYAVSHKGQDKAQNWDWYESQFGYRYSPDSLRGKDWAVWQKAWQHQQAKVEEANAKAQMCRDEKNHAINRWSVVCKERDELQKRVDALKTLATSWISEAESDESLSSEDWVSNVLNRCAEELVQALKGNDDFY